MKTLSILLVIIFSFFSNCISAQEPVTCTESFISSNWSIVGPLEDNSVSNLGRVISIWVDPDDPDYLLIGTRSSGLWKTTDGGENWTNLTNFQLPACGVSSIAVYDNETEINTDDIIYVTTVFYGTEINVYNIGLAFSEDNGETWQYDYSMEGEVDFVRTGNIGSPHVYLKPGTDNLFVLTGSKIVIKDLSSDDWSLFKDIDDFSTDGDDYFTEIDFLGGYSDWMVISFAYGTSADAYYTYNNGANWVSIPAPATPSVAGYNFFSLNTSSCVVNPEMLYILFTFNYLEDVAISPEHKTVSYLYRYTVPIGGSISVTETHDLDGLTSGEFSSDNIYESRELFVPGDKPDMGLIRRGQGELFKIDIAPTGNITAYPVTDYWGNNTHADIRAMTYYRSGATSYVYIAHDGGVSRCDDKASLDDIGVEMNDLLWDNINGYGLSITEFNGFGNSELEENKMFAGSGDGNSYIINNDELYPGVLQFTNYPNNGDFEKAEVSSTDKNIGISNYNGGFFKAATTGTYNITAHTSGSNVNVKFPIPSAAPGETIEEDASTNWSYRPFDFDMNGFFWMGSLDIFNYTKYTPTGGSETEYPSDIYTQSTRTYYKDDGLSLDDVTTSQPITAYKRIENYPSSGFTSFYFATKEKKSTSDPVKFIFATYNPALGDPYSSFDITPNIIENDDISQIDYSWITSIAIDVAEPQQIWISFGGSKGSFDQNWLTPESIEKTGKVYFSPDGGDTWYNRSDGLPNYPVLYLKYWEGSDDIIFAGTDVGVFVWHADPESETGEGEWECFNENLPYCSVNDIEINNCTNTMRISTFGYGIWETPLPIINQEIEITENTVWNQNMDVYFNIDIHPGATLTIENCELRMLKDGRIIVENGGKLVVDDATITNHCDFWKGIEVWGKGNTVTHPALADVITGDYPAGDSDHGVVYLKNNAKIESAETAIATYNSANPTYSTYYGGIIIAHDTEFHNNIVSIDMHPFDVSPSNTDDDNVSEFLMCTFKKDDQLSCDTYASSDVFLNDVDGVLFHACIFDNTFSSCTDFNYPIGINSTNATYTVESDCGFIAEAGCEEYETYFSGYYRGIFASNSAARPRPITIDNVKFINNERAILLSAVTQSGIFRNTFEVPDFSSKTGYGLYLEGCFNYHVEGNYFTSFGSLTSNSHYCSGILVENNHNTATEIYRNTFENIEIGVRSQGNNSKLQIRCNDFLTPIHDYNIIVTSGTLGNQGICNATITQPAGNVFSHDGETESDFRIVPSGLTLNYRRHTEAEYIPIDYTTTQINLQNCGVSGAEDCVSTLPGGTGGEGRLMMTEAADYQQAIDLEIEKIDGGSTVDLIAGIQGESSPSEIKYAVDEASPYISNDVLVALVTEEPLTTSDLLDVMNDNYPISDTVATSLEISNYEVPIPLVETLSEDVVDNQLTVSAMSDLLATIDVLETKREYAILQSVIHMVYEAEIDSALSFIEEETGDWARQQEIQLLSSVENYVEAESNLSEYSTFDTNSEDFKSLYEILIAIGSSGRAINDITEAEETALRTIARKETSSGVAAQNILSYLNKEESYPEIIDEIPEINFRLLDQMPTNTTSLFKIYPNPVEDILYIQVIGEFSEECILNVYSVTGVNVAKIHLNDNFNFNWIDVRNITPGLYFFDVVNDGISIGVEKIVIN